MKQHLLTMSVIEPLHVGAGEGMGAIDRPIFRERTTGYPAIPGSSIKGARKAAIVRKGSSEKNVLEAVFGIGETAGNQGCVSIPDAKILLFPARSLAGTFVWTTTLLPLLRLQESLRICNSNGGFSAAAKVGIDHMKSLLELESLKELISTSTAPVTYPELDEKIRLNGKLVIEGFSLKPTDLDDTSGGCVKSFVDWLAELLFPDNQPMQEFFKPRFVVLDGDTFSYLVNHRTQVDPNIKMNSRGVTEEGSLRYTEFLPAETVLFSTVNILKSFNGCAASKVEDFVTKELFEAESNKFLTAQLGANESTGRGFCRVHYHAGE